MCAEQESLHQTPELWNHFADAVMICNAQGLLVSVNQAFERLTGFSAQFLKQQGSVEWLRYLFQALPELPVLGAEGIVPSDWQCECWCRHRHADPFPVLLTMSLAPGHKHAGIIMILRDLSAQKASDHFWNTQFNYDILTGLPNRQMFLQRLQQLCTQQESFALMVLDLDDMKTINTTTDHQTGDEILCAVALRLSSRKETSDMLARIGGDEFALLAPGIRSHAHACAYAEELMGSFDWPFQLSQQQVYMTAAMGVAVWQEDSTHQDDLLSDAEYALFAAKRYKLPVQLYSRELRFNQMNRQQLQQDLANAIKYHQLHLEYQPIWNIKNSQIAKLEALVRWDHPTRGAISPEIFVPLAEESGLIQSLGQWIFFQACSDLKRLHEAGYPELQMTINRSTPEFQTIDSDASEWLATIVGMELDPSSIVFEITESLLMQYQDSNIQRIQALRAAGCQIAIDDFGTGYSALSYLRNFPLDVVKIDQSFIRRIPQDPQEQVLLDGILHLVDSLGLQLVVEGVETQAQLNYLRGRPCDFVQGFLFSKSLRLHDLLNYLSEKKNTYTA